MNKKVSTKIWTDEKVKWFKETCEKWIKRYHLEDWVVIYEWSEVKSDNEEEGESTLATCDADSIYHESKVTFYPAILNSSKEKWSGLYVENKIKHEIAHMITEKIADLALNRHSTKKEIDDEIESLTQRISIIT